MISSTDVSSHKRNIQLASHAKEAKRLREIDAGNMRLFSKLQSVRPSVPVKSTSVEQVLRVDLPSVKTNSNGRISPACLAQSRSQTKTDFCKASLSTAS